MKYFKVTFEDGKSVTIERPDAVTEDGLRGLWEDRQNVEFNGAVYRTEHIVNLAEVKARTASIKH